MNVKIGTEAARAISFLGIHKWDFRCSAIGTQKNSPRCVRSYNPQRILPPWYNRTYPSVLEMETHFNFVSRKNGVKVYITLSALKRAAENSGSN
jgi:hypothetical protein